MSDKSTVKQFKTDDIIIKEGIVHDEMYKIISGNAAVYFNYGKKDEYIVGIINQGKCFGEIGLLTGKPEVYTVVAVTDIVLLVISAEKFDDFTIQNHGNMVNILKNLADMVTVMKKNIQLLTDEIIQYSLSPENASGKNIDTNNLPSILSALEQYQISVGDEGININIRSLKPKSDKD